MDRSRKRSTVELSVITRGNLGDKTFTILTSYRMATQVFLIPTASVSDSLVIIEIRGMNSATTLSS
jgi:hypothetical protein